MSGKTLLALAAAFSTLGGCGTVDGLLGVDSGRVQVSCAGSQTVAGVPPLKGSLGPLAAGTRLEIVKPKPEEPVQLALPEGRAGDQFDYAWKEMSVGSGRPPGVWLCRVGWQFDGSLWQLSHLDAQWVGGVQ